MLRLFPVTLLFSAMAMGTPIKKVFLSAPTQLCSHSGCVLIEAGVVYVYENTNGGLARGVLAQDTQFGDIGAPKGATIRFSDPDEPGHWNHFFLTSPKVEKWANIQFAPHSEVKFVRFQRNENGSKIVPMGDGKVFVSGQTNGPVRIDGVEFSKGSLAVRAQVDAGGWRGVAIQSGVIAADSTLLAKSAFPVKQWDRVNVGERTIDIENRQPRAFGPDAIVGTNPTLWLDSGLVAHIQIHGVYKSGRHEYGGKAFFHENGKLKTAGFAAETDIGVRVNPRYGDFSGMAHFYETGEPMIVTTQFVDHNARLLPNAFADSPTILNFPDSGKPGGRLLFFFSPQGQLRAVRRDTWTSFNTFIPNRDRTSLAFLVSPNGKGLDFTEVDKVMLGTDLGRQLNGASPTGTSPEMEAYLRTGQWPKPATNP